jgi:membrane-associated protease RseP (regulator of RpoE activity)
MSKKRIVVAAALLSLVAGAANAQDKANSPQNPTAAPQGTGQGTMGNGPVNGQDSVGGMMGGAAAEQEAAKDGGIVGIFLDLSVDAVGAPARLMVRSVAPYSPAYYAGIKGGDQIVAVDGQPVEAKGLSDVAKAIRGEAGTPVLLSLSRQRQSREVSLTRVEPVSEHDGHHMSDDGHMAGGGMMGMNGDMMGDRHQNGSGDGSDGQHGMGMMGHMGRMARMMEACNDMMQSQRHPPNSRFPEHSEPSPNE